MLDVAHGQLGAHGQLELARGRRLRCAEERMGRRGRRGRGGEEEEMRRRGGEEESVEYGVWSAVSV